MLPQIKTLHSRRFLLIYLAVVIMLLLLLTQQYASDDRPSVMPLGAKTFQPPVNLPQLLLSTELGVRSNVHFKQQWTYVVFSDPACQQYCDAPLRVSQAVSSALGPTAPAVFVLSTNKAHCPAEADNALCGVFDNEQQRALLQAAGVSPEIIDDNGYSTIILLINPQAKLQRRYQLPLNSSGLIEDFIVQRRQFAEADTSVKHR